MGFVLNYMHLMRYTECKLYTQFGKVRVEFYTHLHVVFAKRAHIACNMPDLCTCYRSVMLQSTHPVLYKIYQNNAKLHVTQYPPLVLKYKCRCH